MHAYQPQQVTAEGTVEAVGAADQATIYQQGAPGVPDSKNGKVSYKKAAALDFYMKLVKGKWLVETYKPFS